MSKALLRIFSEVEMALQERKPVVALESTVISHGLPFPYNLEVTEKMLTAVRESGAVPAIIALMDGHIKIGLSSSEVEALASSKNVMKVSRADLAYCLAQKEIGATTVSGTMFCAHQAGIQVFATGGIGGVHRGAETTFDISADLTELARTPVLVVCSGAKSILDIPKTLEYLETQGVPVVGYKTNSFPLFYIGNSHYDLQKSEDSAEGIANLARIHWGLGLKGIVVANPVPSGDSLESKEIESFIDQAIEESHEKGVVGKSVTPFLLKRVSELSKGKTLKANKSLLVNNASAAGQIAVSLKETENSTNR
jgi:pseudouridine-5'-phosphate glycosidase